MLIQKEKGDRGLEAVEIYSLVCLPRQAPEPYFFRPCYLCEAGDSPGGSGKRLVGAGNKHQKLLRDPPSSTDFVRLLLPPELASKCENSFLNPQPWEGGVAERGKVRRGKAIALLSGLTAPDPKRLQLLSDL